MKSCNNLKVSLILSCQLLDFVPLYSFKSHLANIYIYQKFHVIHCTPNFWPRQCKMPSLEIEVHETVVTI